MNRDELSDLYDRLPEETRAKFCKLITLKYGEKNPYTMGKGIESAIEKWFVDNVSDAAENLKKFAESSPVENLRDLKTENEMPNKFTHTMKFLPDILNSIFKLGSS